MDHPFPRARPEFRFTREGRVFVFATLGIGIGAVNTGNNLLYLVLGMMLGLLLTSGVLSEIVLRGVRVRRGPAPRVFAGEPGLFALRVTNEKRRFASSSFEVEDVFEREPSAVASYVSLLPAGHTAEVVSERTPSRRGTMRGVELRVRTRFPFGLLEKTRVYRDAAEVLVFPALLPVASEGLVSVERDATAPTMRAGLGVEVLGVRDHREGEPSRNIHWRRTASVGRVVSRERAREDEPERIVRLALVRPRAEDEAVFESDVSIVASHAVDAVARGVGVRVESESGVFGRASDRSELDALLARLALVGRRVEGP